MTVTDAVVETKLENESFLIGGEGGEENEGAAFRGSFGEGTEVAKGSYVVPDGVAVEELKNYGGHKDLKNKCPDAVRNMLQEKDLFDTYDRFVQSIYDTSQTRSSLMGKWNDAQFVSVLDLFRDDFAARGVRVSLCKRKSGKGTYRWLEFIDVSKLGGSYVPQYDVSNWSGQVIKTCYTKLKFPKGVAVEELKQWGGRKKLKEKVPVHVEKMLEEHDLTSEYEAMVDHVVEAGVGYNSKKWNMGKLKELMEVYKPMFAKKGIEIFVCHKQEYISHGQYGGHWEYFRWIEFVDRAVQPSYQPQRDAETKGQKGFDDGCAVM